MQHQIILVYQLCGLAQPLGPSCGRGHRVAFMERPPVGLAADFAADCANLRWSCRDKMQG